MATTTATTATASVIAAAVRTLLASVTLAGKVGPDGVGVFYHSDFPEDGPGHRSVQLTALPGAPTVSVFTMDADRKNEQYALFTLDGDRWTSPQMFHGDALAVLDTALRR